MAGTTASRKASARSKHTSRWPNAPVELPEARQVYMTDREADIMDFWFMPRISTMLPIT